VSVFRQTSLGALPRLDGMSDLNVIAIDPGRLESIRRARTDERGNEIVAGPAEGWEPLRCCLRIARADESLDYDDITFVPAGADLEPVLRDLLGRPQVAAVHVRAAAAQCFTFEVRAAS
jgi:hypothetical protein